LAWNHRWGAHTRCSIVTAAGTPLSIKTNRKYHFGQVSRFWLLYIGFLAWKRVKMKLRCWSEPKLRTVKLPSSFFGRRK
jgi:hypothetical protein